MAVPLPAARTFILCLCRHPVLQKGVSPKPEYICGLKHCGLGVVSMDYQAEQEMEVEALESILMDDFSGERLQAQPSVLVIRGLIARVQ